MKITNILKTIILTGAITIMTCIPVIADIQPVNQQSQELKVIATYTESSKDFYIEEGEYIQEFSDGSFSVINKLNNQYEFTASCLGDWNFSANDQQDLNNIINIYKSHVDNLKDQCNTIKDIKEINRYTDDTNNNITIEYNNGSFALYNTTTGLYQFTPSETLGNDNGGYCINCNDMKQLNNCIATYMSIKDGTY